MEMDVMNKIIILRITWRKVKSVRNTVKGCSVCHNMKKSALMCSIKGKSKV